MIIIQSQEELDSKFKYPSYATKITAPAWHAVYSFEYMRMLAVSSLLSTINSMVHHHINSYAWYSINVEKNEFKTLKVPATFNTARTWEWKYDLAKQVFTKTTEDLNFTDIFYLRLTREKSAALDIINRRISNIRRGYVSEVNSQHNVYRYKEQEAQEIVSADPSTLDPTRYVFVNDYAELTGVDLVTAAREILIQADFARSRLSDTETVRIKYSRIINHAEEIPEIRGAIASFYQETIGHAST